MNMTHKEELLKFIEENTGGKRVSPSEVLKMHEKGFDDKTVGFSFVVIKKKVYYYIIDSKKGGRCFLEGNLKDFNPQNPTMSFLKDVKKDSKIAKRKDFAKKIEKYYNI